MENNKCVNLGLNWQVRKKIPMNWEMNRKEKGNLYECYKGFSDIPSPQLFSNYDI